MTSTLSIIAALLLAAAPPPTSRPQAPVTRRIAVDAGLLVHIDFHDAAFGAAVGGDREDGRPAILLTRDGGATWTPSAPGGHARLYGVHFPTPETGFACGLDGLLLGTRDGGRTWTALTDGPSGWIAAVHFHDEQRGIAAGAHDGMLLAATDDGGATWRSLVDTLPAPLRRMPIRAMHFIDDAAGIATGPDGLIVRTTDGGATWQRRPSGTGAWLKSICFPTPTTGYVAGSGGVVLRTDDAGSTWRPVGLDRPAKLNGVAFVDADRGIVAGAEGAVWQTRDGGATWTPLLDDATGLAAAHAAPGGAVWVCTQPGGLIRIDLGAPD